MDKKEFFDKASKKLNNIYQNPQSWRSELRFIYLYFKTRAKHSETIELVGTNWEQQPEAPIAFIWGCETWKRYYVSVYFPEYRVAFVNGNPSIAKLKSTCGDVWNTKAKVFVGWGKKLPSAINDFGLRKKIDTFTMEDGFLRSFNPGQLHTKPHSLAIDKTGIYYDGSRPSDIEAILNSSELKNDKGLLEQAAAGIDIMRAGKLSKYYNLLPEEDNSWIEDEDSQKALVLGQVAHDASIKYGYPSATKVSIKKLLSLSAPVFSNSDTVLETRKMFSSGEVYYRPHPDHQRMGEKANLSSLAYQNCHVVPSNVGIDNVIDQVDEVVVQTSLSGLEALIRGKNTTVLGYPFYAGWGLTNDKLSSKRRKQTLTLEQLFAGAYLKYPRYIHPCSDVLCSFFDVASYFVVERVKFGNIFDIPEHLLDLAGLEKVKQYLSPAAQLLLYLNKTEYPGSADLDEVMALIGDDPNLADFPQFSQLLIQTSNYDILQQYCNRVTEKFAKSWDQVKYNKTLLEMFFGSFSTCQKNANGRVLNSPPNVSKELGELLETFPNFDKAVVAYARVISQNIEYSHFNDLLGALSNHTETSIGLLQKLTTILAGKPTRSERAHRKRRALLVKAADMYHRQLNIAYPNKYDLFINSALRGIAIDNALEVKNSYDLHLQQFSDKKFSFQHPDLINWGHLQERRNHFYAIYNYLLKQGQYTYVEKMHKAHFFPNPELLNSQDRVKKESQMLSFYGAQGKYADYIRTFNAASEVTQNLQQSSVGYSRALRGLGQYDRARELLHQFRNRLQTPEKRLAIEAEISKLDFVIRTNEIMGSYPQPNVPKGVIILASQTCYNTLAMMAPALLTLKKKGYAIVNIMQGMMEHDPTGVEFIDQFAGCLPMTLYSHSINHSWEVNWDQKSVSASKINFYQGFYERLSTAHRSYYVDINSPAIMKDLRVQIKRSDVCLSICERIYRDLVKRNMNVAIISGNSHVTPFSVFRDFCIEKDDPRLGFINCNIAYENYYTNLGGKFASTMCVTDMTYHKTRRAPFMALKGRFEDWYAANKENETFKERADSLIKVNRNSSSDDTKATELISYLEEQKKLGKKIICCFGKVPVDLNVPYDGGPAHSDMADWITHTAEYCGGLDDVVLLVKPHPHELRPEIALDLITSFEDLIQCDLQENVHMLGHKDINVHALAPYLDLAILYNGSSALELTAIGIPVMLCAHFGRHDYPVDLIYPESRTQYEAYISEGKYAVPSNELRKKAAFLISYMGTDDVSIRNEYAQRQVTNDKVGMPKWREGKIAEFFENGDPNMELIASRIVEKFENSATSQKDGETIKLKTVEAVEDTKVAYFPEK